MTFCHIVGAHALESVVTECEAVVFEISEIMGDIADIRARLEAALR